jgi:outer membrane protein assembly factor BamB
MLRALLAVFTIPAPALASWPQYGGPAGDFRADVPANATLPAEPLWRRPLGPGESGVVVENGKLFAMYSIPEPPKNEKGTEVMACLDAATGKTVWEHRYPVARLPKQETFRGAPVGPQATPCAGGGKVFALGYAGVLTCLTTDGKEVWTKNLVKDFEATPVQFGFSGSPVLAGGKLLVAAGGKQTALIAFDPTDGSVKWKTAPAEPGYATPVVAKLTGEEQVILLTRDAVAGYALADGTTRWTYPLPKPGLTNVPTPLVLPDAQVLVSGQGQVGTALLKVTRSGNKFEAKAVWQTKPKFFYCNWARAGDAVCGYADSRFVAFRWKDGSPLWDSTTQNEGNVVAGEKAAVILRGDGRLTLGKLTAEGFEEGAKLQLFDGRAWSAPTVSGGVLYARNAKEIVAVPLGGK